MARDFLITIVGHVETVWWDPGVRALETAVDAWLDVQRRVSDRLGRPVRSTFCALIDHPTPDTAEVEVEAAPDLWRRVLEAGHEVGLHVHAPTETLKDGLQDRLIAADVGRLIEAGMPRPRCYAAGDWVVSPDLARTLEQAGFEVDVSVQTLFGPMDRFGATVDHRRPDLRPYRPSRTAIDREGDSTIVEIPPSGDLSELADHPIEGLPPVRERIRDRLDAPRVRPDVFQLFWHPFDFVTLGGLDGETLASVERRPDPATAVIAPHVGRMAALEAALIEIGEPAGVRFVSATEAARSWREAAP